MKLIWSATAAVVMGAPLESPAAASAIGDVDRGLRRLAICRQCPEMGERVCRRVVALGLCGECGGGFRAWLATGGSACPLGRFAAE